VYGNIIETIGKVVNQKAGKCKKIRHMMKCQNDLKNSRQVPAANTSFACLTSCRLFPVDYY
jgi:hypothetical protein